MGVYFQLLKGQKTNSRFKVRGPDSQHCGVLRKVTRQEEIPGHLPHLTLPQIFDALSSCSDHQTEIDAFIERNWDSDELVASFVHGR